MLGSHLVQQDSRSPVRRAEAAVGGECWQPVTQNPLHVLPSTAGVCRITVPCSSPASPGVRVLLSPPGDTHSSTSTRQGSCCPSSSPSTPLASSLSPVPSQGHSQLQYS